MFFELIAAVVAGGCAAGVVMLLNRLTGRRLPRWLMPVAAGVAMIGYTIAMEYSWYERTSKSLPSGIEVVVTHEASNFWRPWTYFSPVTDRFIAIDVDSIRTNESVPRQRMVDLFAFARWQSPKVLPMVYDCEANRSAPLLDDATLGASGEVENLRWAPVPKSDTSIIAVCKEI